MLSYSFLSASTDLEIIPEQNAQLKMAAKVICKTCKYFRPDTRWFSRDNQLKFGLCQHPSAQTVNLVSGHVTYEKAEEMRYRTGPCGLNAQYYEKGNNVPLVWHEIDWLTMSAFLYAVLLVVLIIILFPTPPRG